MFLVGYRVGYISYPPDIVAFEEHLRNMDDRRAKMNADREVWAERFKKNDEEFMKATTGLMEHFEEEVAKEVSSRLDSSAKGKMKRPESP